MMLTSMIDTATMINYLCSYNSSTHPGYCLSSEWWDRRQTQHQLTVHGTWCWQLLHSSQKISYFCAIIKNCHQQEEKSGQPADRKAKECTGWQLNDSNSLLRHSCHHWGDKVHYWCMKHSSIYIILSFMGTSWDTCCLLIVNHTAACSKMSYQISIPGWGPMTEYNSAAWVVISPCLPLNNILYNGVNYPSDRLLLHCNRSMMYWHQ